jgi:phosphatidylglycerophosphatase A
MTRLAVFLASAGYTGYVPFAPGTIGSLVGLVLYAGIHWAHAPLVAELAILAVVLVVGVWAAGITERHLGLEDPGPVVIDEVAGMLITLVLTGVGWSGAVAGFLLFRFFDIVKPYPASKLERLGGGLGIMADDVMAGLYANVALRLLLRLAPGWAA